MASRSLAEISWCSFELSAADIAVLRGALEADAGETLPFSDDEIGAMARETLEYIAALFRVAQARVRRQSPLESEASPPSP